MNAFPDPLKRRARFADPPAELALLWRPLVPGVEVNGASDGRWGD